MSGNDFAVTKVEVTKNEGSSGAKNRRRRRRKYYNDAQRREAKRRRDKEYRERKRATQLMLDDGDHYLEENLTSAEFISTPANPSEAGNDYEEDGFDDDDDDEGSVSQDLLNPIVELEEDEDQEFSEDFSDFGSPDQGRANQMTAAERIESKRRRDREYRQRKRGLDFEASELQTEKKMGRRSKYATEEERLESKRLRDSRYRSRQKAKHQVAEEGVCQVEVENGFENVENYWNEDAQANENFGVTNESSGRGKKVTHIAYRSFAMSENSRTSSESKVVNGRKYFSQEERRMAKRRRDAEYRERMRLKRLIADESVAGGVDNSPVQPIVVDIHHAKSKPQKSGKSQQPLENNFDQNYQSAEDEDEADLKGRKYFSAEERAQGKLRRNAEYRERLRVKKMLEDQGLDFINSSVDVTPDGNPEIFIQAFDPATNQFLSLFLPEFEARFVQKRRRYLNDEERAAAKKRRDAEYRERQKVKKFSSGSPDEHPLKPDEPLADSFAKPIYPPNPPQRQDYPVDSATRMNHHFNPEMVAGSLIRPQDSSRLEFSSVSSMRPNFMPAASTRSSFMAGASITADFRAMDPAVRPNFQIGPTLRQNLQDGLSVRQNFTAGPSSVRSNLPSGHSVRSDYSFDLSQRLDYSFHQTLRPNNHFDQSLRPYLASHRPDYPVNSSYYPIIPNGLPYNPEILISKPDHPVGPPPVQILPSYQPEYSREHTNMNFEVEEPDSVFVNSGASDKRRRRIYRSDADRKAAKRRRDAEYRERQRLKKMAPPTDSELSYDSRLSAKTNDYENYPDLGMKSFSKAYNESDWNSSNHFGNSDQQGNSKRKRYSNEEERAEAKRRRDAAYRERQRLRKLAESGDNDEQENQAGDIKVSHFGNRKSESDHSLSLSRQQEADWMKGFDENDLSLPRRHRYRLKTQEERAAAKKRRDAEYRERQKLKKILDDTKNRNEKISVTSSVATNNANAVVRRRRKFFNDEERVEAKRRRDAEYRDRQRLKRLLSEIEPPKGMEEEPKFSNGGLKGSGSKVSKSGDENSSSYSVDEIFDDDDDAVVNVEPIFEES